MQVIETQTDIRRRAAGLARRGVVRLEGRDPRWAELTVPVIWQVLKAWLRPDVRGLEQITATGPVQLGGVPVYIDGEQYERRRRPAFVIDVSPGAAEGFSLDALTDRHFVTRTRERISG